MNTVVVAGRILVPNGEVLTVDEDPVRAEAQSQAREVTAHVAADPVHKGMALREAMEAGRL